MHSIRDRPHHSLMALSVENSADSVYDEIPMARSKTCNANLGIRRRGKPQDVIVCLQKFRLFRAPGAASFALGLDDFGQIVRGETNMVGYPPLPRQSIFLKRFTATHLALAYATR